MNYLLRLTATSLITAALLSVTSCGKDDDNNTPVCRISSINSTTGSSTAVLAITYNNDGKVSTITSTSGSSTSSKVFTYSGNAINITEKNGSGTVTSTNNILTDSRGYITSIISKNGSGTVTNTALFEYDGNGKLSRYTTQPAGGSPVVTTVQFSNGDATSTTSGSSVNNYEYYSDKPFADGDYLKFLQFINYGAYYLVNAHMLKSSINGSSITNYSYDYDSSGKIIRTVITGSSVITINYAYICN